MERQLTSPADSPVTVTARSLASSSSSAATVEQPVSRQATSPFDVTQDDPSLSDKIRNVGDKKSEFISPKVKLIYTAGDATSLFVAAGGNDQARVGERIEVHDWAQNTGLLLSCNGKKCSAAGSLSGQPTEAKALKSAQRIAQALAEITGVSFPQLLHALAKAAEGSTLATWRAQCIAQVILSPETPIKF